MPHTAESRVDFDEAIWRERLLLALQSISISLATLAEAAAKSTLPVLNGDE
jgi:hypothetical protein